MVNDNSSRQSAPTGFNNAVFCLNSAIPHSTYLFRSSPTCLYIYKYIFKTYEKKNHIFPNTFLCTFLSFDDVDKLYHSFIFFSFRCNKCQRNLIPIECVLDQYLINIAFKYFRCNTI